MCVVKEGIGWFPRLFRSPVEGVQGSKTFHLAEGGYRAHLRNTASDVTADILFHSPSLCSDHSLPVLLMTT